MGNLSIIIPSRNRTNLEKCIRAVRNAGETCMIVIIDDGMEPWPNPPEELEPLALRAGRKPFIFARNINLGIELAVRQDVVLLNDDALLQTPGGFALLQKAAAENPEYGLIAAACNNVGNENQFPQGIGLREDPRMVCFVAVLIPRRTIDLVGLLDEAFVGYGCEDDDYSLRVRNAGLKIGIHDGCFVDHRNLPSTFRGSATAGGNYSANLQIFKSKWKMDNWGNPA
jgi:GT2 family glycosyltransferase